MTREQTMLHELPSFSIFSCNVVHRLPYSLSWRVERTGANRSHPPKTAIVPQLKNKHTTPSPNIHRSSSSHVFHTPIQKGKHVFLHVAFVGLSRPTILVLHLWRRTPRDATESRGNSFVGYLGAPPPFSPRRSQYQQRGPARYGPDGPATGTETQSIRAASATACQRNRRIGRGRGSGGPGIRRRGRSLDTVRGDGGPRSICTVVVVIIIVVIRWNDHQTLLFYSLERKERRDVTAGTPHDTILFCLWRHRRSSYRIRRHKISPAKGL